LDPADKAPSAELASKPLVGEPPLIQERSDGVAYASPDSLSTTAPAALAPESKFGSGRARTACRV